MQKCYPFFLLQIIIINQPFLSTGEHGLLQMSPVFSAFAASTQYVDILFISSVHLVGGLPRSAYLLLASLHSRSFFVHLPSSILAICPAHLYFCFAMRSIMSSTPVRLQISSFLTRSFKVKPKH